MIRPPRKGGGDNHPCSSRDQKCPFFDLKREKKVFSEKSQHIVSYIEGKTRAEIGRFYFLELSFVPLSYRFAISHRQKAKQRFSQGRARHYVGYEGRESEDTTDGRHSGRNEGHLGYLFGQQAGILAVFL